MSAQFLIAICSDCHRATSNDGDPPICSHCRKKNKGIGTRKKTKFVREPHDIDSPLVWQTGKLPCRRCGAAVIVAKGMELASVAGEPVIVECERLCERTVILSSIDVDD